MSNPNNYPPQVHIPKPTSTTTSDQVKAIINITLSFMEKRLHKSGNVYLVDPRARKVFFIDEEAIFNTITDLALINNNLVLSNSAIQTAKRILKSEAGATPSKISLRVGLGQHAYFLDFGDGLNYIQYSEEGASRISLTLHATPPIIDVDFFRPPNLSCISVISNWKRPSHARYPSPYDEPKPTDWLPKQAPHLNYLLRLTNIPEKYYSTVITWMVCTLFPEREQAILEITGEESSGKSTAAWIIKSLIDPADKALNEAPNTSNELIFIAQNSHIIAIDNADDLSESMQKLIYELSNNGIQSQSKHGNSGTNWNVNLRNPVIVTSTSSMITHTLLVKKSISIDLPNLEEAITDHYIKEKFQENQFFALFELAQISADVLKSSRTPSIKINNDIYFDNFTLTGAAVCKYFDIEALELIQILKELKSEINDDMIDDSVVARAFLLWAAKNSKSKTNKPLNHWHKELSKILPKEERDDWPNSTRKFGAELKKIAPRLKKKGVFCKSLGKQGSNVLWEIRVSETTPIPDDIDDV